MHSWQIIGLLLVFMATAKGETGLERHHEAMPDRLVGEILIEQRNCYRCHGQGPSDGAPVLATVGTRLRPEAILQRIISPQGNMPDVLGHLAAEDRDATGEALAHYLGSLSSEPLPDVAPGDVQNGRILFHQVGCVACHSPEKEELQEVAKGYHRTGLVAYLENPLESHPSGRMPNMQLKHKEARDIAAYLLDTAPSNEPESLNEGLVRQGRTAYLEHGCAKCHESPNQTESLVSLPNAKLDQGCLSQNKGNWPNHRLTDWQRDAILTAIREPAAPSLTKPLAKFNCLACHEHDGLGGVPASLDTYFTSSNLNLGDQSRLPPKLDGVGSKLTSKWLHKVLEQGASARPYMHTRMPIFPREAMAALADALGQEENTSEAKAKDDRKAREAGHKLVGVKGFGCVACHTFKGQSTTTLNALDLTTMTARLQKDWFQSYMLNPPAYQPLTIMPSYWPNGISTRPEILEGDPDKQIEALWQYLRHGRDARSPEGLKREPILLTVKDEAVMLRRNYRDVGKRGIGVGYPSGIHLVFDAGQMRLASIWTGDFVEASGAFRGQGSGHVHPRSRDVSKFPSGAAFAKLTDIGQAWPTSDAKKAEGFQFKGYDLDEKRRPSFRYTFEGLTIEDTFRDKLNDKGISFFERTLTFSGTPTSLYFRAATGEAIAVSDVDYNIDGALRMTSTMPAHVRSNETGNELLIPLTGETLTLTYHP